MLQPVFTNTLPYCSAPRTVLVWLVAISVQLFMWLELALVIGWNHCSIEYWMLLADLFLLKPIDLNEDKLANECSMVHYRMKLQPP